MLMLTMNCALTEVVATSACVHAPFPASFMRRHLESLLRRISGRVRTEVADLQLGKFFGEVLERHPATQKCTN